MKKSAINFVSCLLVSLCCFLFVIPQAFGESTNNINTIKAEAKEEAEKEKKSKTEEAFEGINFGVALSLTMDLGDHERVESAEVINGLVRVTKDKNDIPRVMLETHYFFLPNVPLFGHRKGMWGVGPFVGIQNGSNEFIESIGAGLMLGFRRSETATDSFNISIGAVVDPSVKILGDGIEENEPLPEGESKIRYKETSQWGALFMVSYSF